MDLRMVDGAGKEGFMRNQPVLVIEEERGKLFTLSQSRTAWLEVNDAPGSRN